MLGQLNGNIGTYRVNKVGNDTVVNYTIAEHYQTTDADTGEITEHTVWTDVEAWNDHAKRFLNTLDVGDLVRVSGTVKSQAWIDEESGEARSKVVVRANFQRLIARNRKTE